ncbi:MAG: UDP-N-acetylglucosamine 2-epimerase (non-hydrolyzing) [Nanoarchaeota archaeon]|nr:UDP-N-acetylglucosamine 2-epimerase (non-hydrolyzing) [Nanoarchaeota archaeon]
MRNKKILTVVGTRPQIVKAAVISRYIRQIKLQPFEEVLVHTGQHYDFLLSDIFFKELGLQKPKYNLDVGSHEPAKQVALMLERLDNVIKKELPNLILVYGDTNSTLAASICSMYRDVPLVHVEAGERMYRRNKVPEEYNRVLADNAAFMCLTCTKRAQDYLVREGMCPDRVRFVGDPMYDLFKWAVNRLDKSKITYKSLGLEKGNYHLSTIHRVENTSDYKKTVSLLSTLDASSKPVVLPVHPRLRKILKSLKWYPKNNLRIIEPLGYFEFLSLLLNCDKCVTDTGGVTREAFFARKPCIIPMSNSWWADIVEAGWALESGNDYKMLADALEFFTPPAKAPENLFGDGNSAKRIVEEISNTLEKNELEGKWHRHGNFYSFPDEKPRAGSFTYFDYENIVHKLKSKGYKFAAFHEAEGMLEKKKPFVLMRHDVDMDLEAALQLARLEAKLGAISTYFFLIRTEHYNVFSKEGSEIISGILKLGHHLGLHLDCAQYPKNLSIKEISKACSKEAEMLEGWFGKPVRIVSYHRPDDKVLSGNQNVSSPRKHTYMPIYNKKIKYFSDSNGKWKFGLPAESDEFKQGLPLHILVHPVWWNENSVSGYETLLRLVQKKNDALEHSIAKNCSIYRVGYLGKHIK